MREASNNNHKENFLTLRSIYFLRGLDHLKIKFKMLFLKILFFCRKNKNKIIGILSLCIFFWIFFSEYVFAATLEEQLDSANILVTDKIKKYGIISASIAGGIWAIFKGNVKQAGIIVLIAVILSYYLSWVEGGMTLTSR